MEIIPYGYSLSPPKQMTINNHSQEDNGAEKLVAGSELLPPLSRAKSWNNSRILTTTVQHFLAPPHQATTHSK